MSLTKLRFTNQAFSEASLKTFLPGGGSGDATDADATARAALNRRPWPIGPNCRDLPDATVMFA
jgi:hypothetical protein